MKNKPPTLEEQLRLSLALVTAKKLLESLQRLTVESDREINLKCEEVKVRKEQRGRV